MTMRLEFSIGPVQGFVAQSRRTRDLWGSSYLLSFLSAHAIRGAVEAGARIIRPVLDDDPMYRRVSDPKTGASPGIGSTPNLFIAEVEENVPQVAKAARAAFNEAWNNVSEAVRTNFITLEVEALGNGTREIWNRQTGSFWELAWAAGGMDERGLLARRKLWRDAIPPDEPGDKCTVMPQFQELSGHISTRTRNDRIRQEEFWEALRSRVKSLDLREDEQLCAVALIKRLFPRVAPEAIGWEVNQAGWPSIVYIASVPWVQQVLEHSPEKAELFAKMAREVVPETRRERIDVFAGLGQADIGRFASLDGTLFHRNLVEDVTTTPIEPEEARNELIGTLKDLYATRGSDGKPIGPPSPFYALLLADGDRLGQIVAELGSTEVGKALNDFTASVPDIVRAHSGVTVYAGGDDVLALLPMEHALACAEALQARYTEAFKSDWYDHVPTISVAVTFAHMHLALNTVIKEAHRLLDQVAKDGNGRNSLAVGVLKRGGINAQWVSTWSRSTNGRPSPGAVSALSRVVEALAAGEAEERLSSSLLYRLRESLGLLCGWPRWVPGEWGEIPTDIDISAFVRTEVLHSLDLSGMGPDDDAVNRLTEVILELLRRVRSPRGNGIQSPPQIGLDGLLVARFLARGGREEDV